MPHMRSVSFHAYAGSLPCTGMHVTRIPLGIGLRSLQMEVSVGLEEVCRR